MAEDTGVAQTDDDFEEEAVDKGESKPTGKTFSQEELDRIVADRVSREKSKYKDYGDLKKRAAAAMTDNEKALHEAEQRGRSAATESYGKRLAKSELRAAAAGQVAPEALDGFLEFADMSRFVGEDGEPDAKAIASAIKKLGTAKSASTNYDGGARSNAEKGTDMNSLIRRAAGHQ